MITLTDIAYVRSGVADLDGAVRFAADIVGLELVAPTEVGVAHLRADHRHHCLALVEGPSGVISSGFSVADSDALAAAETELERSGAAVRRGSAQQARVGEFPEPLVEHAGGHPVAPGLERSCPERTISEFPQDPQRPASSEQIQCRHQRPAGRRAPHRRARSWCS